MVSLMLKDDSCDVNEEKNRLTGNAEGFSDSDAARSLNSELRLLEEPCMLSCIDV